MKQIKAIDTLYKGYKFRSRLEARWAIFFDELGFVWEYEYEGFNLKSGYYLPDFYLPEYHIFLEVKPIVFNEIESIKCGELSSLCVFEKGQPDVILLDGQPDKKSYKCFHEGKECSPAILTSGKFKPLYWNYDFDDEYFKDEVLAINKARKARFEFSEYKG